MNLSDFDLTIVKEDKKLSALYKDILELQLEIFKKNEKMRLSELKSIDKSIAKENEDDIMQAEY